MVSLVVMAPQACWLCIVREALCLALCLAAGNICGLAEPSVFTSSRGQIEQPGGHQREMICKLLLQITDDQLLFSPCLL